MSKTAPDVVVGEIKPKGRPNHSWGIQTPHEGNVDIIAKTCARCGVVKLTTIKNGKAFNYFLDRHGNPLSFDVRPLCTGEPPS